MRLFLVNFATLLLLLPSSTTNAFVVNHPINQQLQQQQRQQQRQRQRQQPPLWMTTPPDRRSFLVAGGAAALSTLIVGSPFANNPANALPLGPVKIDLKPGSYFALPCPPSKPIPGEKAMKGMRGLCVTVEATLEEAPPKDLEKVGVYGFIKDGTTGDSVLANNPDLSTDAGQFSMIESVTTKDKTVSFEFVAAVPLEKDLRGFENGIGPLTFESLRLVSFPGGQQYGEINPCEMNEFSDECDAWEEANGPYKRGDFMVKSNPRTMGR